MERWMGRIIINEKYLAKYWKTMHYLEWFQMKHVVVSYQFKGGTIW
jgi:hypothetical protein